MHDLRKHSSDDTRMAREARWLQVPEVMPNPKPRCTCPKTKTLPVPSPPKETTIQAVPTVQTVPTVQEPEQPAVKQEPERKLYHSASMTVERKEEPRATLAPERPELKKHASEDTRLVRPERARPKLERSHARVDSQWSKKWSTKEKVVSPEERKKPRHKWAMKPHFSLPAEKKESKLKSQESTDAFKSKSLKERPKYSIRRSLSPEPDPRQMSKLDNRIVRRLITPGITITNAKWTPYEDSSPLPTIGIKKREPKPISEIKWTPYDASPSKPAEGVGGSFVMLDAEEPPKDWSPFHNITPTHHPPPEAAPCSDDEEFRMRILNQVAAFPMYQGGWKDESPEKTPPKRVQSPVDLSPPVWSPLPASPIKRQRSQQQQYSPQPVHRKSIVKARGLSKKKVSRARSESGQGDRLVPPTVIVRAASEEPKRQRPQLVRSKALLEVPTLGITKRSLSEEVPRARERRERARPHRARSEETTKYGDPWFTNDTLADERTELREYVTTV